MHIGFITPEYPHQLFNVNIGGIGTFIKNLAEQLVLKNYNVTIFIYSQSATKVITENGIEIHLVKIKTFKGLTWLTNRRSFNKYVNDVILKNKIDVVEAPEWTGFTAFMKFKCPLIIRLHGSDTYFCNLESRKVKAKNKFFERNALIGADKVVGVSKFVAKKTKELFKLNKNIEVIYNTVDATTFTPNHNHIQPKSLLYFGTIIRKKGVLELAQMFTKLVEKDNEVSLILLGKDSKDIFTGKSTLKMMKEILSEKALKKITHVHAVPYHKVINYIQQAEVVVLPSFAEAFPMTWLEAMALEKKLVTSNIGWANELMIDGTTGFMVNPTNIKVFKNKVITLLENKEKADLMAVTARKHLKENFNFKKNLTTNRNLYKSCT
ncbi:glycosyltransferase family 4 protein [Xanthomarina gelatinilytica]|uniref:glycosyltransferase family 4 protein n=1 Tax=Xanthomarina gelatinilytica TaxID=1137281 RepID=UPI003AA9D2A8